MTITRIDQSPSHRHGDERTAREDLAALFRACAMHDLHEGIDNHCSLAIPGRDERFLLNPFGPHWTELCASDLPYEGWRIRGDLDAVVLKAMAKDPADRSCRRQ